jgi:hypothetical protein
MEIFESESKAPSLSCRYPWVKTQGFTRPECLRHRSALNPTSIVTARLAPSSDTLCIAE